MSLDVLPGPAFSRSYWRAWLRGLLNLVGFETTDWVRVVMYRECFNFIRNLGPGALDVLEISPGPQWRRQFRFKSYVGTGFPAYDVCQEIVSANAYDLIIADQVFEHLKWPYRAGKNVHAMLRPGGHFVVTVPFLIRVHDSPIDCSRWTETGLSYFLQECGFEEDEITTGSWGNRACVRGNFVRWKKRGWFRSLRNEPRFPVVVWAFARRS
jgi:hypothetical protein